MKKADTLSPESIRRNLIDTDGISYDVLFAEALELAQHLSSSQWTDYNPHDPGVTILEQLCYVLTDLGYRTNFEIGDYLTDKFGEISYRTQAFYLPHEMFPSQAITTVDYEKLLFSAIKEITDVSVNVTPSGLYKIRIAIDSKSDPETVTHVKKDVASILAENRQLGENFEEIIVVENRFCWLTGDVEISGDRDPSHICAEIYHECSKLISSDMYIEPYNERLLKGDSIEELFTGPFVAQGFMDPSTFNSFTPKIEMASLIRCISAINGVRKVASNITLECEKGGWINDCRYELQLPEIHVDGRSLTLKYNSSSSYENPYDTKKMIIERAILECKKLKSRTNMFRSNLSGYKGIIPPVSTTHRNFNDYTSIQNEFPPFYGINSAGLPKSAEPKRIATARQMKAYLFPFEQIMGNCHQTLDLLSKLFSIDTDTQKTYFSALLTNEEIPNIEELYATTDPDSAESYLTGKFDSFVERKNRIFDSMIAMYGESFPSQELIRFNPYYVSLSNSLLLEMKMQFIINLQEITMRRTAAAPTGDQIGSWEKRIRLLLGMRNFKSIRYITYTCKQLGVSIINDSEYSKTHLLPHESDYPHRRVSMRKVISDIDILKHSSIEAITTSESMLRHGCDPTQYYFSDYHDHTHLYFHSVSNANPQFIATFSSREQAILETKKQSSLITRINQGIELFHVVEHINLRPVVKNNLMTITVVFPGFGARFSNLEFRRFAQRIITENSPAHLYVQCMWLDLKEMMIFEPLYIAWVQSRFSGNETSAYRNGCSAKISLFIEEHQQFISKEMWI